MEFPFSIVTGKTILGLLQDRHSQCVRVVEHAYLTHHRKQAENPPSMFLRFPEKPSCRIIALPAYLGGEFAVSGIKWIASYPENTKHGFPRASAVLILNSYETGYPFACLESSIISAARTAASAVLGAEHLNGRSRRVGTLGIIGTGLIARYVYTFLLETGWDIDTVLLHDLDPAQGARFRDQVCRNERHGAIRIARGADELIRGSDMVVLATVAGTPHIENPELFAHNPIVLHLSLRDLAPAIITGSYNIVDDVDHVMKANTSLHLVEQQLGHRDFVTGTLAELILGECSVDRSRPLIFSPFGMGILDLAVGKWFYELAASTGEVTGVDDFFYELDR